MGWRCWSVGVMVLGMGVAARGEESGWVSQVVMEPRVGLTGEVAVHAWARGLGAEVLKGAKWEIRTADEKERVAVIDEPWVVDGGEGSVEGDFSVRGVTLANGGYVMGWMVGGERKSNVVRFEIGPGPATEPKREFLRIVQGEARKVGELPMVEVVAKRWTEKDPDAVDLAWTGLMVDGQALTRKVTNQRGHGAPMLKVGEGQQWRERWEVWEEAVDATAPHTVQVLYGDAKSAEVALLEGTALGDGWDAATGKVAGDGKVSAGYVAGVVEDQARGENYRVELLGGGKVYEARSGVTGRFLLVGIPLGEYELTCEPMESKERLAVVEKVEVTQQPKAWGVTFEEKYGVSGKVMMSAEDGGGAAAGWMVRGTFVSEDGNTSVEVSAETGADGGYVLKGPYEKVSFVGVVSSPEPAPVKDVVAPKEGVDFRLTGEKEEMRRVR